MHLLRRRAALTKEHFWPDWAGELLGTTNTVNRMEELWARSPLSGGRLLARKERPGPTHKKKIRKVCRTCNNGWMSALEDDCKPILTPLILDQSYVMDARSQRLLARWIMLKVFIGEWNDPENVVSTPEMRENFKNSAKMPPNLSIWIAQCGKDGWEAAYVRNSHTISLAPIEKAKRPVGRNIQCVTFGIGGLLIHARHIMIDGVGIDINRVEERLIFPLWPCLGAPINWPPNRRLAHWEVAGIADAIGWLQRQPGVLSIP
jgi:hypothetical protein